MKQPLLIYWLRRDLRLADNPALVAAVAKSRQDNIPLLPLFILEDYMLKATPEYQFGYPSRFFVTQALTKLATQLPDLTLVCGKAVDYLIKLNKQYTLQIFVNDDVYIDFYKQLTKLKEAGLEVVVFEDALSVPKETRTQTGKLYSVFTPFKKAVWADFVKQRPLTKPSLAKLPDLPAGVRDLPAKVACEAKTVWSLFAKARVCKVGNCLVDLDEHLPLPELTDWYTDEAGANKHFKQYLRSGDLDSYDKNRNSLELDVVENGKTSKMSLALAWGLLSSRQLLDQLRQHFGESFANPFSLRVSQGALTYISELIWREFYRYQLFHHPELMNCEFQERFRGTIAWAEPVEAKRRFLSWVKGETGYQIVDAAMRQLASTGWMHNRSRMIVASILTKNLGVDWRWGQEYFRATLIDLDEASNNGGWQWGASVGTDPKPIRIFNPDLQAKNYDASGAYRARWLGVGSGQSNHPKPIVEHKTARTAALKRYGLEGAAARDY